MGSFFLILICCVSDIYRFIIKCNIDCVSLTGGRTARRAFEFGQTYVVKPKGKHQVTIVWLHGLGDNGSSWSQLLETLSLPNVRIRLL
ncbi:putative phospholipase/carboxylesterase/thioesterase, alpha/Beta hydrolase [Helianthus anomalus]